MFQNIRGFNCLRSEEFITPCGEQITRGHPLNLRVQHCRIDARKYFLVHVWLLFGTNYRLILKAMQTCRCHA